MIWSKADPNTFEITTKYQHKDKHSLAHDIKATFHNQQFGFYWSWPENYGPAKVKAKAEALDNDLPKLSNYTTAATCDANGRAYDAGPLVERLKKLAGDMVAADKALQKIDDDAAKAHPTPTPAEVENAKKPARDNRKTAENDFNEKRDFLQNLSSDYHHSQINDFNVTVGLNNGLKLLVVHLRPNEM